MAHYAFLDENNIVTEVIFGIDETELIEGKSPEEWYGEFKGQKCVRTSYNGKIRKNYAGIGYSWDGTGFAAPQPYPSWILNQNTYLWESPIPMPTDGKIYNWNEDSKSWDEVFLD